MKKQTIIALVVFLIFSTHLSAQEPSWNKKMGDRYFQSYSFFEAIKKYEFIKNKDLETQRKLAQAYFYTGNYEKAESYYQGMMAVPEKTPQDIYRYASVLSINEKYAEAKKWMKEYAAIASSSDKKAMQYSNKPGFYKSLAEAKQNITIENLAMNTKHTDFGAALLNGKVVFASSNPHGSDLKKNWNWNKLPFLDLFIADTDTALQLNNIETVFEKKGKYHRGPATFNAAGDYMVFTSNNETKNNIIRLKLYYSKQISGKWSKPQEMPFNGEEFSAGLASLTADGNTIYFASDRPGTIGSSDLWVAHRDASGTWGEPKNLGESINTAGKESFPFIHNDGTLYFVSDGLPGLGGLDIYTVPVIKFGEIDPENLGAPFNSSHDDFAFLLADDELSGYFSSNRPGGKGDDDIYKFNVIIEDKIIEGIAADDQAQILAGVEVILKDQAGQVIETVTTGADGKFEFTVKPDQKFTVSGTKEQYKDATVNIDTDSDLERINADLKLPFIPDLSIKYVVTNKDSGEKMKGVVLKVTDNATGKTEEFTTSALGEYIKALNNKLNDKLDYTIKMVKQGFFTKDFNYKVQLSANQQYVVDLSMEEIEIGRTYKVGDLMAQVNYDYRSWELDAKARKELDGFVKFMNDNPTLRVELSSHTDCRGTDIYNSKLSDKRAKACANYIKTKISTPTRLTGRGYGASKPIADCACGDCSEEQHRMNRRTEFRIISY